MGSEGNKPKWPFDPLQPGDHEPLRLPGGPPADQRPDVRPERPDPRPAPPGPGPASTNAE
jgi:hypothetical protein